MNDVNAFGIYLEESDNVPLRIVRIGDDSPNTLESQTLKKEINTTPYPDRKKLGERQRYDIMNGDDAFQSFFQGKRAEEEVKIRVVDEICVLDVIRFGCQNILIFPADFYKSFNEHPCVNSYTPGFVFALQWRDIDDDFHDQLGINDLEIGNNEMFHYILLIISSSFFLVPSISYTRWANGGRKRGQRRSRENHP